jgi:hypothetical protein
MISVTSSPRLMGFFSCTRADDKGVLSDLRTTTERNLQRRFTQRLWLETNEVWIDEAVFFIAIVTPRALESLRWRQQFKLFMERQTVLGRDDRVFSIVWSQVHELENRTAASQDQILQYIGSHGHFDWRQIPENLVSSQSSFGWRRLFGQEPVSLVAADWPIQRIDDLCNTIEVALKRNLEFPEGINTKPPTTREIGLGPQKLPRVFISYRRDQTKYQARAIHAACLKCLPPDYVFVDIDSIPPGSDFVVILEDWVKQCQIFLALIGPDWVESLDSMTGLRRLDDPNDFVRIEIREALRRGIPVVPVLLDGAVIPAADRLPEDIRELVRRHAASIEFRTFDVDVERLLAKLGVARSRTAE